MQATQRAKWCELDETPLCSPSTVVCSVIMKIGRESIELTVSTNCVQISVSTNNILRICYCVQTYSRHGAVVSTAIVYLLRA